MKWKDIKVGQKMKDGSVKQIYHTTPSVKRGRTLGDMVHESYLNLI